MEINSDDEVMKIQMGNIIKIQTARNNPFLAETMRLFPRFYRSVKDVMNTHGETAARIFLRYRRNEI